MREIILNNYFLLGILISFIISYFIVFKQDYYTKDSFNFKNLFYEFIIIFLISFFMSFYSIAKSELNLNIFLLIFIIVLIINIFIFKIFWDGEKNNSNIFL
jgi:hypothetical protein